MNRKTASCFAYSPSDPPGPDLGSREGLQDSPGSGPRDANLLLVVVPHGVLIALLQP